MSKKKHYPVRIPRYASGIRAQESRGLTGRSWWAKRWLERLEAMGLAARLGRGKNYALSGQVTEIKLQGPHVAARVVGSRPGAYDVTVDFCVPDEAAHARLVANLRAEPMLLARLLVDELPLEIETLFRAEGCELFPGGRLPDHPDDPPGKRRYDMTTACSCPDYANPCKHAVAVLLILGEEIARRPMTLLELRGITMEELCDEA